ncbi:MAG: hypothetical protein KAR20_17180 [Candidatus Heimdallarchaeota archaeon]|nr:hypothetical protein [Candidatus Heimdallarchaeota archaeon]
MNTEEKEDCDNCYFYDKQDECPVPFVAQGQLSSTGHFYCPFWIEDTFLSKVKK